LVGWYWSKVDRIDGTEKIPEVSVLVLRLALVHGIVTDTVRTLLHVVDGEPMAVDDPRLALPGPGHLWKEEQWLVVVNVVVGCQKCANSPTPFL